jgi:hypothetical protein
VVVVCRKSGGWAARAMYVLISEAWGSNLVPRKPMLFRSSQVRKASIRYWNGKTKYATLMRIQPVLAPYCLAPLS